MTAHPTSPTPLSRPPAVEVIYGLHAGSHAELKLEGVLAAMREGLPAGFRVDQPINAVNIHVTAHNDSTTSETRNMQWTGVSVVNEDGSITGHFMRNGLFVNFSKYVGYDGAIGPVQELWGVYSKAFGANVVMQLSMRYINVIRLPFNSDGQMDLDDYFKVVLKFPVEFDPHILNFHHQFTVMNDMAMRARIMLSSMREDGDHLVVAFDNEGYREGQWSADTPELWNTFQELRDFTYHIFRSILTDKCRAEIGA